jgi:hypothetical protein
MAARVSQSPESAVPVAAAGTTSLKGDPNRDGLRRIGFVENMLLLVLSHPV